MMLLGGRCSALLGFVIMFHSYYYFPFGVSLFGVTVSLSNITQRISSINYRFHLSRLDEVLEESQFFCCGEWWHREYGSLAAYP